MHELEWKISLSLTGMDLEFWSMSVPDSSTLYIQPKERKKNILELTSAIQWDGLVVQIPTTKIENPSSNSHIHMVDWENWVLIDVLWSKKEN